LIEVSKLYFSIIKQSLKSRLITSSVVAKAGSSGVQPLALQALSLFCNLYCVLGYLVEEECCLVAHFGVSLFQYTDKLIWSRYDPNLI
jgi:hypothetical protein